MPKKWLHAKHPYTNRRESYFCTFWFFRLYFSPLFPGSSRAATHSCQLPSMCCPSMPCAADATHTIHLPWRMEPVSRVRQRAQPQRHGSCGVWARECRLQACSPSTCPHFHLSGIGLLLQMRCLGSPMHSFDLNLSPPFEMPALKCREGELFLGLKELIQNPDLRYNNLSAQISSPTVISFLNFSLFLMISSPMGHKYCKEKFRKQCRTEEKTWVLLPSL